MNRYLQLTLLNLLLLCSSLACTPKLVGPTVPSSYFFAVQPSDTVIWLQHPTAPRVARLPRVVTLVVRVQNAQGRPVNGVPVTFTVPPAWERSVYITPQQAITHNGMAQTVLEPRTTGALQVMIHVENLTQRVTITVSTEPTRRTPGRR